MSGSYFMAWQVRQAVAFGGMRSVVMDSNAVDPLADLPGAYETAEAAVQSGNLEILFTHVTIDELAAIDDLERRRRLLILLISLGRLVSTGAFIVGHSRLNFGRINDDTKSVAALRSGGTRHSRDALIGSTALVDGCALVTYDDRLAARARDRGVKVMTTAELLAEYGFIPGETTQVDKTGPERPGIP